MDMGDGARSVRSAKYELPIFNKTNKTKYAIGCVHLTTLTEETLSSEQSQRLIYNKSINIQGGKNNNLALDEYLEMLNRDSKEFVKGHQTKASIISHSKKFPHLINFANQFDIISQIKRLSSSPRIQGRRTQRNEGIQGYWSFGTKDESKIELQGFGEQLGPFSWYLSQSSYLDQET